jgi:hypothetical protein
MTDDDLTGAGEARERARRLLAKAAERRAAPQTRTLEQQIELEGARDRLQTTAAVSGLHDLLRDLAAYLGDRPQRDAEAMGLYERVMRMLGEGER